MAKIVIRLLLIGVLFVFTFHRVMAQQNYIIVSKEHMEMSVYNNQGDEILKFPIACGKKYGQKQVANDNRTPEGVFKVVSKEKSDYWTYDFGEGPVKGAYGPLFIRLDTRGFKGIGIHGTHDENTVPGRETHGCIRLKNTDLLELSKVVNKGTVVIILPGKKDVMA